MREIIKGHPQFKVGDKVKCMNFGGTPLNGQDVYEILEKFSYDSIALRNLNTGLIHTGWYPSRFKLAGPLSEADMLDNIKRNIEQDL